MLLYDKRLSPGRRLRSSWGLGSHSHLQLFVLSQAGGGSTPRGIPGESRQEKEALGGRAGEMSFPKREVSEQEPT